MVLAKLTLQAPNLLLLDEITNNLDIESINSLAQALNRWEGSYIVSSHDMTFINAVCTEFHHLKGGKLKLLTSIDEYVNDVKHKVKLQKEQGK